MKNDVGAGIRKIVFEIKRIVYYSIFQKPNDFLKIKRYNKCSYFKKEVKNV